MVLNNYCTGTAICWHFELLSTFTSYLFDIAAKENLDEVCCWIGYIRSAVFPLSALHTRMHTSHTHE